MSIVGFGVATLDDNETTLLDYPAGGIFTFYADGSALGAQDLTIRAYTRVNEDSELLLAGEETLAGAAPADPAVAEMEVVSSEPVLFTAVLSTATPCDVPWRVHSSGRLTTVEDGEGAQTASGGEDSLTTVPYGGTFLGLLDVSTMQAGDDLELRFKARAGDLDTSPVVVRYVLLQDAQDLAVYQFGPVIAWDSLEFTLEQSAGTPRLFGWKLVRVG